MHQRGPALVRIALLSLLFGAFALALVQPSQAGTAEAPEIQDARFDVVDPNGTPVCSAFPQPDPMVPTPAGQCVPPAAFADLVSGWIANETASELRFWIDSANTANAYGEATYEFHFTIGTTDYVAGLHVNQASTTIPVGGVVPVPGDGAVTGTGVATAAVFNNTLMMITVPKSAIGNPPAGTVITKTFLTSQTTVAGEEDTFSDRAPDGSAFGQDYVLTGGSGTPIVPGDSDNDGLNDTCEQQFFGGLNGTSNATEDPDGDGLTNGQECASNPRTDPTKADSDGDGTNDKNDPFPTDATKGGTSTSGSRSESSSTSRSSSSSATRSGSGSTSRTSSTSDAGEVKNLGDAVEKLKSDVDYLGTSAGGMVAVLILAILALAVRWSL